MGDTIPQDTPQKHCTKCSRDLPATSDFFCKDKKRKDGLYPYCNECRYTEYNAKHPKKSDHLAKEGYKQCPKCQQVLPATSDYWNRDRSNKKDGLQYYCRSCQHDIVQERAANDPDIWKKMWQHELEKSPDQQERRRIRAIKGTHEYRSKRRQPGMCSSCLIRSAKPGRRCDVCRATQAQWVKNNPEHIQSTHKKIRDGLRLQVLNVYGGKCTCCGEVNSAFLAIDHINGGGSKHIHHTLKGNFYFWLRKNGFPQDEFQILCHNCNFAKHAYGICPHQAGNDKRFSFPSDRGKRWLIALRQEVISAYGNKCLCCGEARNEFLVIDHINNDGAEHRRVLGNKGGRDFYRWLKQNGFPQGDYQILCWNCNHAKRVYDICPHQHSTP